VQKHNIRTRNAISGEFLEILCGHDSDVSSVAWSPDGGSIVSGSWDKTARIWDAASGECRATIEHFPNGEYAVWDGDGTLGALQFASKMAWQYLGWQTTVDGKPERLPAEIFGRLPTPPSVDE
jgi:WD40 repeat protein